MKTDCPHCGAFARILQQALFRYGNKIAVLSIAPAPDSPATAAKFISDNKLTFPILFDCGQVVYSYVRPNPLNPRVELPHLYIVDREGYILKDLVFGPETEEVSAARACSRSWIAFWRRRPSPPPAEVRRRVFAYAFPPKVRPRAPDGGACQFFASRPPWRTQRAC